MRPRPRCYYVDSFKFFSQIVLGYEMFVCLQNFFFTDFKSSYMQLIALNRNGGICIVNLIIFLKYLVLQIDLNLKSQFEVHISTVHKKYDIFPLIKKVNEVPSLYSTYMKF